MGNKATWIIEACGRRQRRPDRKNQKSFFETRKERDTLNSVRLSHHFAAIKNLMLNWEFEKGAEKP